MKKIFFSILCFGILYSYGQGKPAPTLKSILLDQLKTTHNQQEWFVPAVKAVAGLTPEQAMWKQGNANHSIGQLVNHLIFWNKEELVKFKGEKPINFNGKNDETFEASFDKKTWAAAVQQLDDVLTEWEKAIESADDARTRQKLHRCDSRAFFARSDRHVAVARDDGVGGVDDDLAFDQVTQIPAEAG